MSSKSSRIFDSTDIDFIRELCSGKKNGSSPESTETRTKNAKIFAPFDGCGNFMRGENLLFWGFAEAVWGED